MTASFFRSRWVDPPTDLEQLDPALLPDGFRAGGVACGLKGNGKTDLGLVVCDSGQVESAILLTASAAAAAPVRVCRRQLRQGSVRAAIVNSGNANAATGEQGLEDALAMRDSAGLALGLEPEQVAVAETGVIGVPLDMEPVLEAINGLAGSLSADGAVRFSEAIMTTDQWPKQCTVRAGGVTVSAQAKGAGMIEPGFATMLCFVQSDARLEDPEGSSARPSRIHSSGSRLTAR